MFDGIQNYLSNPIEHKKASPANHLVGLSLIKAKRDLEDKIKVIDKRISKIDEK